MRIQTWFMSVVFVTTLVAFVACGADTSAGSVVPAAANIVAPASSPAAPVTAQALQQIEYTQALPSPPLPAMPAIQAAPAPPAPQKQITTPLPQSTARAVQAAASRPASAAPVFPVTVKDGNGDDVVFDSPPERIVAFDSAVVEILFAIGEGDRVVGTHEFVTSPQEANDVTRVGSAFNMDIEATVALEPDLVFLFFDRFKEDVERAGLRVLFIPTLSDDFNKVADRIRLWGEIVGNPASAEAVASDFEERVKAITVTMADYTAGPSVFQDEGALWTPGQGTLIQQVFDVLKLENIAFDVVGYEQFSPELIVERDPGVIIGSYGDSISDDPVFKDLLAVQNGSVYVPTSDALSIAGPRFIQGIEELARWIYPGLFP